MSQENLKIGVVMDPIGSIKPAKDTTLAMLLAAQARGWRLYYFETQDLYLRDGEARARGRILSVRDSPQDWFHWETPQDIALASLDAVLMRKDPPFDMEYIYSTYILERAEEAGVLVVNRPQALRDANEKAYTAWFPQCCPPTLMTRSLSRIRAFLAEHHKIVVKPLEGMGGTLVFVLAEADPNISVVLETLTGHGTQLAVAQKYLPEISEGDKRILLIDGEPVPYALARIPAPGESRGNLAAGGHGVGVPLSARDRWICQQVAPALKRKGLLFVGLDVIGEHLTEINVTSPTCARELDKLYGLDIAGQLMDVIASKRRAKIRT
ncbi:MAG: glutathione synthase [Gammaproteobacteria bacterium]|nr:glutathione synthase [Gammaproteobacteria bacterium]MBU6509043.1 glutathione synthase [Gammaproteobacteria bacterium]MDE1983521.1 glutathione synthase [Gammaproteobacteria bacterium]MDE2107950.1 glutathione synthase [Gammaproteobacteria bacterium]MDE2460006.1 glutathione synthase [Gammaproteobacteria bacterium]